MNEEVDFGETTLPNPIVGPLLCEFKFSYLLLFQNLFNTGSISVVGRVLAASSLLKKYLKHKNFNRPQNAKFEVESSMFLP